MTAASVESGLVRPSVAMARRAIWSGAHRAALRLRALSDCPFKGIHEVVDDLTKHTRLVESVRRVPIGVDVEVERRYPAAVSDGEVGGHVVYGHPVGGVPVGVDVGEHERAAVMATTVQEPAAIESE